MLYSNELMNIYENAIKDSKANLQKENTKNNILKTTGQECIYFLELLY